MQKTHMFMFFSSHLVDIEMLNFQNVVHTDGPAYVCSINNPNEVFIENNNLN